MTRTQTNLMAAGAMLLAMTTGFLAYEHWPFKRHPFETQAITSADNRKHTTRILTWWGEFDSLSKTKELETLCDTQLEIVDYMYVEGLERLAETYSYDLYIYPWSYHEKIAPYFEQQGPTINWTVDNYHRAIKEKYHQFNTPPDTVFFQLATQMFVYDTHWISDLDSLTAEDVLALSRSNDGKVLLMDNLWQMDWFIKQLDTGTPEENWQTLYQQFRARRAWNFRNESGLRFYNFATKYLDNRLILGFLDSGELMNPHYDWKQVVDSSGQPKALAFGTHPSLSQVSYDVLALKSHDSRHLCIAHALSSRRHLRWVAETGFYYSPYEEHIDSHPEYLQQLTREFYDNADKLPWLYDENTGPPSPEAQGIWKTMIACQYDAEQCEQWTALSNKIFAGSS